MKSNYFLIKFRKKKKQYPFNWGTFFHLKNDARYILVDTEPKVVSDIISNKKINKLLKKKYVISTDGSGNNWSLGYYHDEFKKTRLVEKTLEKFEIEKRKCDYVKCVLFFHSLSGGTGSGLGSRLIEELKTKYPSIIIFTVSVFPFTDGDNNLKAYNTLFALSWLQKFADGIFLFQNDELINLFSRDNLFDINKYISICLLQLFLPIKTKKGWKPFSAIELLNKLCPDRKCKILDLRSSTIIRGKKRPKSNSWSSVFQTMKRNVGHFDIRNKPVKIISSNIIIRGYKIPKNEKSNLERKLENILKVVKWNKRDAIKFVFSNFQSVPCENINLSITLVSNRSHVIELLNKLLSTTQVKLDNKAYLHWYERYNCKEKKFYECMNLLHEVIIEYFGMIKK